MEGGQRGTNQVSETTEKLKILVEAYVRLNELSASPGERSHRLWTSTTFIEKQIKAILKEKP